MAEAAEALSAGDVANRSVIQYSYALWVLSLGRALQVVAKAAEALSAGDVANRSMYQYSLYPIGYRFRSSAAGGGQGGGGAVGGRCGQPQRAAVRQLGPDALRGGHGQRDAGRLHARQPRDLRPVPHRAQLPAVRAPTKTEGLLGARWPAL